DPCGRSGGRAHGQSFGMLAGSRNARLGGNVTERATCRDAFCKLQIVCSIVLAAGRTTMSFRRTGVIGLALLAAIQVRDSGAKTTPVMAYVAAKNANPKRLEVFKQGLTELGYLEGRSIRIESREAVLDAEYHGAVGELINLKVDIILAANVAATVAAAKATRSIPIVMLAVFYPFGQGVVKSLGRPGPQVTGTTMYGTQLIEERLRILKRIVPNLDKVAMALNGNNVNNVAQFELLRVDGQKLGIKVQSLDIRKPEDVDAAFDKALAFGAKAL